MKLTPAETRFMDLLWEIEPIPSGELVTLCSAKFGWKKSTTYTFIKRLQERNIVINEKAVVRSLADRQSCQRAESRQVMDSMFQGSLPQFVTAFLQDKKLSDAEIDELIQLLDQHRKQS